MLRVVVPTAAIALGLALRRWANGATPPITDAHGRPLPNGVATSEMIRIGGVDQFVVTRGRDRTRPVLLVLHGGPGDSETAIFRHHCPGLEDHFVIVYWDQRGAGRSFDPAADPAALTVDRLVADAAELTDLLRVRFSCDRIRVMGHSWGSYLGLRLVAAHPALFEAFVGIGQVVDQRESESRGYAWAIATARAKGLTRAVEQLERVGPPTAGRYRGGIRGLVTQRRWVRELGGAAHGRTNLGVIRMFAWPLVVCPEYRVIDLIRYTRAELTSMKQLEEPMLDDPPLENLLELDVPVFVIQGRHDHQTDTDLAATYIDRLIAPDKRLVVFEQSGHLVPFEQPDEFVRTLVELVGSNSTV